jgi:hypothetical protein
MGNFQTEITVEQTSRLDLIDQSLSQNEAVTNSAKWRNIRYLVPKLWKNLAEARGATTTRQRTWPWGSNVGRKKQVDVHLDYPPKGGNV